MSKRTVTCVEWVCDDCGEKCEYDDAHFRPDDPIPNRWQTIDGKDVCDQCIDKRACAVEGHQWGNWTRWFTPGEERRYCCRCEAVEARHG